MVEIKKGYWEGKYLEIKDCGPIRPGGKTRYYEVMAKNHASLGCIRWWSNWRQYIFIPNIDTIFDASCLIELVSFLDDTNETYKQNRPRDIQKEKALRQRRMEMYRKNRLTKEASRSKVNESERQIEPLPQGKNEVVEGRAPLAVELGEIYVS